MPYTFDDPSKPTLRETLFQSQSFWMLVVVAIFLSIGGVSVLVDNWKEAREYQAHQARAANKARQEAVAAQGDAYRSYVRTVNALPQVGIQINRIGRYTLATANTTAYYAAEQQVSRQINADRKLTPYQKEILQKIIRGLHEDPGSKAQQINAQTVQQLRDYVNAFGVNAVQDNDWLQTVGAMKGPEAVGQLQGADALTVGDVFRRYFP